MKASADNRRISLLLKMIREEALIPRPDFQRRVVWTNPDKIAFIQTILEGYPFPEIYIAASTVDTVTGDATEILVDGQQRLRTIEDYFKGLKPFNSSRYCKKYVDLTENEKKEFLNYEVAVRNLGLQEEDVIREIFRRMNRTSYNLNEMERYNAVYLGEFKKLSEAVAEDPFLREIGLFSANDIRRMKDVSYVASVAATMLSDYFNRDDEIEDYLSQYNETFPEKVEIRARFRTAFAYIAELGLPEDSRVWKKADFYNLVVEVDRQLARLHMRPDPTETGRTLRAFYEKVDLCKHTPTHDANVGEYYAATLRNTNDRSQRVVRGGIIRALLEGAPRAAFQVTVTAVDKEEPALLDEEA